MQRMIVFDPRDLLQLITHYSDGEIPVDAEVRSFGVHAALDRMIQIMAESKEFDNEEPINVRYGGKKILVIDEKGMDPNWLDANEDPKRFV